jgi:DHA1 family bicyclomycin/chloramphenicol resistance-like MFS transporter
VTTTAATIGDSAPTNGTPSKGTATGREFIALVTGLMAMTALGIDLMLPAFPDIRAEYGMAADSTKVAWIVTAYFLGMSIGPWFYGPLSDRIGRRRPLYAGLVLYMVGASMAALAPTWTLVVVARFVWGVGASGPRSLAVTMVRDRHEGDVMARLMSMIMAVFMLVPILAPALGAGLIHVLPWRAVFWFPAVIAVVMMVWARRLPETLHPENRRAFSVRSVAAAGREMLTHRQAMGLTLAMTFLYSTMTAYIASVEVIVGDVYGYGSWFPLIFASVAVLFAANSLFNARLVRNIGVIRLVRRMSLVGVAAASALFGVSLLNGGRPNFWLFSITLAVALPLAQGLTPNCNSAAMDPLPHVAGTASAIIATLTTAGGAVLGGVAANAFDGTVRPFATYVLGFVLAASALIWWGTAKRRHAPTEDSLQLTE